ncbi:MAG: hypothetical protein AAFR81_25980 [Chloroflexota bacterium]
MLFQMDNEINNVENWFSVPLAGGEQIQVNNPLVANGDIVIGTNGFLASGNTLLYIAEQDTDGVFELYSAPINGVCPQAPVIEEPVTVFEEEAVTVATVTPLVFIGGPSLLTNSDGTFTVTLQYTAPVDGSPMITINLPDGVTITSSTTSADQLVSLGNAAALQSTSLIWRPGSLSAGQRVTVILSGTSINGGTITASVDEVQALVQLIRVTALPNTGETPPWRGVLLIVVAVGALGMAGYRVYWSLLSVR